MKEVKVLVIALLLLIAGYVTRGAVDDFGIDYSLPIGEEVELKCGGWYEVKYYIYAKGDGLILTVPGVENIEAYADVSVKRIKGGDEL